MRRVRLTALVLIAALWGEPSFAQVERPDVKLTLDWAFQGPQSVFTLPAERGYYKAEGLNVTVDRGSGSNDAVARVASGAYQFGWGDPSAMIKYNAEHAGQELIAVFVTGDASPNAVIALKKSGIAKPKDLEGKILAATAASAGRLMFDAFAQAAGIDAKAITWQTVSGQLREPMLVRGDVAAVAGFTTSSVMSIRELGVPEDQIVALLYKDYGIDVYGMALWTTIAFAEANPKTVAAVVRAANRGIKDAIADPRAAVASLKSRDALLNLDIERERLLFSHKHVTLTPFVAANGLGTVVPERMRKTVRAVLDSYGISTQLPLDKVYTDRFLPPQAERIPPALGS
jgi:NitT/TauT family transport system substrate-binding protein